MTVKFNAGHSGEEILRKSEVRGHGGVSSYPKCLVQGCQINTGLWSLF